ncbi:thiamine phosphate synthase [Salinibacter altiplanensis]|uniref:thiamine phosphate synthase n=1 Tax=Salinibacter altiplanensis TaxID=1803181 RepID=UPI000C9FF595|nr:thiamine phosphate synthase [Salinibacter altiplanensis]
MASLPRPPLALIADGFTSDARADRAVKAVQAGVRWVHLRDHEAKPKAFATAARVLAPRLRSAAADVTVTVNSRVDVAEALGLGAHVGRRGPSGREARERLGAKALLGYSAHEHAEAKGDRTQGVDYYFFSPVFPTTSKPDQPPAGVGTLRAFCRVASPVPVLALGGITPERVSVCRGAGARGVAVLSGIMDVDTPRAAARAYLRALAEHA